MLTGPVRRGRGAFTLVEILIGLVIIAVMAAVLVPAVGGRLRQSQASAIGDQISNLTKAIAAYRTNVLRYPRNLDLLTNVPVAGVSQDICSNAMVAANVNLWRGPYMDRPISGDFPIGDATVVNLMARADPAATAVSNLILSINLVDTVAAVALEAQYDGNANFTTGAIRWTWTNPNVGTLQYYMPIRNC
ncbi:MAG: prepilin-type N-terminal cleavage/methylation domain-containing protein [Gemmatimonadaceae bacterium]